MSTAQITQQLEDRGSELPGPPELRAARRSALKQFGELGWPGKRLDAWRYTDLSSLGDKDFSYIAPVPDAAAIEAARTLLDKFEFIDEASRLVFIDGHRVESLSVSKSGSELEVQTTALKFAEDGPESALAALNTAFAAGGTTVRVTGSSAALLELVFIGTGRGFAPQLKLMIELAAGTKATVIQRFIDLPDAGEAWLNLVTDIEQAEDSELSLYRLQTHAPEQYQTTLSRARLAHGAKLAAGNVEVGGNLIRNEFEICLEGNEAEARVFGIALTNRQQHCDTRIAVKHQAPHTTSRQEFRAIVADTSRSVFNGKVIVREEAQNIDAHQQSDNLLLSPTAEADTRPELEIHADQVVCSHGATVGELSDDHLFYLRARGIDEEMARGILIAAFADTILERIDLVSFREQAREAVNAKLPRQIEPGSAAQ